MLLLIENPSLTDLGVAAIIVILVLREVFGFIERRENKKAASQPANASRVESIRGGQIQELFKVTREQGQNIAALTTALEAQTKLQDERHEELRGRLDKVLEQTAGGRTQTSGN